MVTENDRIYSLFSRPVARYLQRRAQAGDVDDLVQETFERFFREKAAGRLALGAELSWLFRVARNLAVDSYRRNRIVSSGLEDAGYIPDAARPPENTLFREELRATMVRVAQGLHSDGRYLRLLLLLLDGDDPQGQIAKKLGYSIRTVRRMTGNLTASIARELKRTGITSDFLAE